jgi:hypothetical protein
MNKAELLEAARAEILEKTHEQIEEETAWRWAARAVACFEAYEDSHEESWASAYEDYRHEAIEHAAFADRDGSVIQSVRAWIKRHAPH